MSNSDFIYKVTSREVFDASLTADRFLGMPVDQADGYLHFSTAAQLRDTLRLYFSGQSDLMLFAVRASDLGADLRWEPSRGGRLFPHLFGDLQMSAVTDSTTISVAADGTVTLPDWVK